MGARQHFPIRRRCLERHDLRRVGRGATAHEWLLFSAMDPAAASLDHNHLKARVSGRVGSSAEALIAGYEKLLASRGEPNDPLSIFAAIETDRVFRIQGERLADALATRGQSPYHYEFTVLTAERRMWEGQPDGAVVGRL
jgi:hypothetical protein